MELFKRIKRLLEQRVRTKGGEKIDQASVYDHENLIIPKIMIHNKRKISGINVITKING